MAHREVLKPTERQRLPYVYPTQAMKKYDLKAKVAKLFLHKCLFLVTTSKRYILIFSYQLVPCF